MSAISSTLFAGAISVPGSSSCTPKPGAPANTATNKATGSNLTPQQQKQVDSLKSRDADVRRHEAAHLAASGGYARGGASFTFQTGPDGKQYAVGGEVQIDASPVPNNPQATIQKMQVIEAAALAPADPSGQDRSVAASAAAQSAKAQAELATQRSQGVKDASANKGGSLDVYA
jgi:hypothetical protein